MGSGHFKLESMETPSALISALDETLIQHGADLNAFHRFDEHDRDPDLLPYATLVNAHSSGDEVLGAMLGVYEWQDTPLIFLVNGDELQGDIHLRAIRRRLAMRGDAPYLGVVRPGRLAVYQVSLDASPPAKSRIPLDIPTGQTFAYLSNYRPGVTASRRRWISEIVLKLLDQSISELMKCPTVTGEDAISLVGRALFTRFLGDRGLLPESLIPGGFDEAKLLFDDPDRAEATSEWLNRTFNGEFLPLREGLLHELPQSAFRALGNILNRAVGGQLYFEWREDWAHLDFAHIPVGVLSQAYEGYLRKHLPQQQRKEGGYYTPSAIAQLMVHGAFHALKRNGIAHQARVLDPAAGAGVFLLTAFRQLVIERWRHDDERPDTKTLREILYQQITGFDINESALRFAALGLYLLSIELDPNPEPVEKLRFEDLRKVAVLQKVGTEGELGSLGPGVGDDHMGQYDLVIGNPPWASSTQLKEWSLVDARVREIAEVRVPQSSSLRLLPNQVLDLPFVWRSMEWAKPGGQIAFALHARLLFQQHEGMPEARSAIFSAIDVTGVVNGAEVRHSNVWPEISAPFCLFFARNQLSAPGAGFLFVSPHLEDQLNNAGSLRIDAENAEVVTASQVAKQPEILKILFRGSPLDVEIFERLTAQKFGSLRQYWQTYFGGSGQRLKFAGNGYQNLRLSSPEGADGMSGVSPGRISMLPELTPESMHSVLVDHTLLSEFREERLHRRRSESLFRAPLLLVHQSPPAGAGRIRVAVSDVDLVFSETYYGYSAYTHPYGRQLVRYLALVISSTPALWYCLVTSGKFGFERDVIEKATIDGIPVPPFEALDAHSLTAVERLFNAVAKYDNEQTWADVDMWVANLYGFRKSDIQVIQDTLRFNLPFAANRRAAQLRPSRNEVDVFCATLLAELEPWAVKASQPIVVEPIRQSSPWQIIKVQIGRTSEADHRTATPDWHKVLHVADQLAATEVLQRDEQMNCLWVARLAQARYWSPSQARMVARGIVWEHVDMLFGSPEA